MQDWIVHDRAASLIFKLKQAMKHLIAFLKAKIAHLNYVANEYSDD